MIDRIDTYQVPQGSVLSTVLCNLYYGMIEKKFLGFPDHTDENSTYLLMRLTDDFLFISTSRARAEFFANKVHHGLPEYVSFYAHLAVRAHHHTFHTGTASEQTHRKRN